MNDGLGVLIISPTRELAYQTFEVLKKIGQFHDFSAGLIIGGKVRGFCLGSIQQSHRVAYLKDLKGEQERINRTNIVVCTPGRLLQHFDETWNFSCENLKILSQYWFFRCNCSSENPLSPHSYRWSRSNIGYGLRWNDAFDCFQSSDWTTNYAIFCDTNQVIVSLDDWREMLIIGCARSIRELALVSLKKPVYVSVHEKSDSSTPSNLTQVSFSILKRSYPSTDMHCRVTSFVKSRKRLVSSGHSSKIISSRKLSSSFKAANRYRSAERSNRTQKYPMPC